MNLTVWGSHEGGYRRVPTEKKHVDYTPLYNYIDSKKFISIKDGDIDVEENKITNLKDPENDKDAVNRSFCNNNRKTKCYVGYLPTNHTDYGFNITSTYITDVFNRASRNFVEESIDVENIDIINFSRLLKKLTITITCLTPICVWGIYFKCSVFQNHSQHWESRISGSNDNNTWNIIYIWTFISKDIYDLNRHIFSIRNAVIIEDELKYIFININNKISYKYYSIEFRKVILVPLSEDIGVRLTNFQMYVYND